MFDLLVLAADEAANGHAGGDGHGSPVYLDVIPFATALIVFGIAYFILMKVVWPKITAGLDEREEKIRSGIAAAEKAQREAEAQQAEFERQLAEAREESERERTKLRANIQAYREELRTKAEEEVSKMKERALRDIDSAKYAAVTELHGQAAQLASSIASKILEREISADDQQDLVAASLRELSSREA